MKAQINCLVIEEQPLMRSVLRKYIDHMDFLSLKKECSNHSEALRFMRENENIDLCFVDLDNQQIQKQSFYGIMDVDPKLIATCTSQLFESKGEEWNENSIIEKPITFDRFVKTVSHVTGKKDVNSKQNLTMLNNVILESGKKKYSVPVYSILYIEGMSNYVKVITTEKTLIIYQRLRDLEVQLAPYNFKRIHKSFIVPMEKVDNFSSKHVYIRENPIPIGYSYKKTVDRSLKSFVLK